MSIPAQIVLTQKEQDDHLETIAVTVNNLFFAIQLAAFIRKYVEEKLPVPAACVRFDGKYAFSFKGEKCGFIVLPVLQMAVLDCRRSLEFFGLRFDRKKSPPTLAPLERSRKREDIGVEHFGLTRVPPGEFLATTGLYEPALELVDKLASRQLAHFTTIGRIIAPQFIQEVSHGIITAFHVHLYDALKRPRPVTLLKH